MQVRKIRVFPPVYIFLAGVFLLSPNSGAFGQYLSDKVPTVTLCELGLFPFKYDGKMVRISGTYIKTFESAAIADPSCDDKGGVGVKYSCDPVFACKGFDQQLSKFTTGNPFDGEIAKIVAVGKVEYHGNWHTRNRLDIEFHVIKIENVSSIERK